MNATNESFRTIAEDPTLTDAEIKKYLNWGKGNLEQALNYYYRKKEKQNKEKSSQGKEEEKRVTRSVFDKMKNASIREKQTEQFIKHVKEEYQLPITKGGKGKESKGKQSKGKEKDKEEMVDEEFDAQFEGADYIPEIFAECQGEEGQMDQRQVMEEINHRASDEGVDLEGNSLEIYDFQAPK